MKPVVIELVETHIDTENNGYYVDWMGYPITDKNPLTFHHIIKKADGGEMTKENGALLTIEAHEELNVIEQKYPNIYKELNQLFIKLNQSGKPPTEEYWHELRQILSKIKTLSAPVKVYRRII